MQAQSIIFISLFFVEKYQRETIWRKKKREKAKKNKIK